MVTGDFSHLVAGTGIEGMGAVAPNLSVTFNQPMVALTGIGDLAKPA